MTPIGIWKCAAYLCRTEWRRQWATYILFTVALCRYLTTSHHEFCSFFHSFLIAQLSVCLSSFLSVSAFPGCFLLFFFLSGYFKLGPKVVFQWRFGELCNDSFLRLRKIRGRTGRTFELEDAISTSRNVYRSEKITLFLSTPWRRVGGLEVLLHS